MPGLSLLAHQGGWDELLLVATPIALFAGLLGLANRRAGTRLDQGQGEAHNRDEGHEPEPEPDQQRRW